MLLFRLRWYSRKMSIPSPLQPWIDFGNFLNVLTYSDSDYSLHSTTIIGYLQANHVIQPCAKYNDTTDCSDVCGDNPRLFDPQVPQNLVTCGSWAQAQWWLQPGDHTAFQPLGLNNQTNVTYTVSVLSSIASCFESIYMQRNYDTSLQDFENGACDTGAYITEPGFRDAGWETFNLSSCIRSLCVSQTMNQDLGGIGVSSGSCEVHSGLIVKKVFTSYLLQSGLAIVAFILLIAFEPSLLNRKRLQVQPRSNKHTEIMLAALIEFQKAQCYFAMAVQVAALIYVCIS